MKRLSINLADDTMEILQCRAVERGDSITETVRRAIAYLDFFEAERAKGHTIVSLPPGGSRGRVLEFVD